VDKPFVLLADDNEGTCTLVQALLQPEFEVDVASDPADAIEKLKSRQYAAILLDSAMPLLDALRDERPELLSRVLVLAAATTRDITRIRMYGVRGIITKPFEIELVLTAVREAAGKNPMPPMRGPLLSSGMLLLLAEFVRRM
jgi:DNA-binding response OmpR family regulator